MPDYDRSIAASREKASTSGIERKIVNAVIVTREKFDQPATLGIPDPNSPISPSRGNPLTVGAQSHDVHVVGVALQGR